MPCFRILFPRVGVLLRATTFFRPSLKTLAALAILSRLLSGSRHFLGSYDLSILSGRPSQPRISPSCSFVGISVCDDSSSVDSSGAWSDGRKESAASTKDSSASLSFFFYQILQIQWILGGQILRLILTQ